MIFMSGLGFAALTVGGFTTGPILTSRAEVPVVRVQATASEAVPETTATIPAEEPKLTPDEEKAAAARLVFDRALVDAAVLNNEYESFRRGRSKKPISLSAFRSLELRLTMIADADPANTQARDMANMMKMRQYEILQPSVEIAASANRLLYAHAMAERMRDDGTRVMVSGADNSAVRFMSPHMTRQMAMQLSASAKIPEKAKALQFQRVVFGNGRRSWTYDVRRNRLR
jgi:hypothetical protein